MIISVQGQSKEVGHLEQSEEYCTDAQELSIVASSSRNVVNAFHTVAASNTNDINVGVHMAEGSYEAIVPDSTIKAVPQEVFDEGSNLLAKNDSLLVVETIIQASNVCERFCNDHQSEDTEQSDNPMFKCDLNESSHQPETSAKTSEELEQKDGTILKTEEISLQMENDSRLFYKTDQENIQITETRKKDIDAGGTSNDINVGIPLADDSSKAIVPSSMIKSAPKNSTDQGSKWIAKDDSLQFVLNETETFLHLSDELEHTDGTILKADEILFQLQMEKDSSVFGSSDGSLKKDGDINTSCSQTSTKSLECNDIDVPETDKTISTYAKIQEINPIMSKLSNENHLDAEHKVDIVYPNSSLIGANCDDIKSSTNEQTSSTTESLASISPNTNSEVLKTKNSYKACQNVESCTKFETKHVDETENLNSRTTSLESSSIVLSRCLKKLILDTSISSTTNNELVKREKTDQAHQNVEKCSKVETKYVDETENLSSRKNVIEASNEDVNREKISPNDQECAESLETTTSDCTSKNELISQDIANLSFIPTVDCNLTKKSEFISDLVTIEDTSLNSTNQNVLPNSCHIDKCNQDSNTKDNAKDAKLAPILENLDATPEIIPKKSEISRLSPSTGMVQCNTEQAVINFDSEGNSDWSIAMKSGISASEINNAVDIATQGSKGPELDQVSLCASIEFFSQDYQKECNLPKPRNEALSMEDSLETKISTEEEEPICESDIEKHHGATVFSAEGGTKYFKGNPDRPIVIESGLSIGKRYTSDDKTTIGFEEQILVQDKSIEHNETFTIDNDTDCHSLKMEYGAVSIKDPSKLDPYAGKEFICKSDLERDTQQQGATVFSNEEVKKDSDFNTNDIKGPAFIEQTSDRTTYDSPIMTGTTTLEDTTTSEDNFKTRIPEQIQNSIKGKPIEEKISVEKSTVGSDKSIEHTETFVQEYKEECLSFKKGYEAVSVEDSSSFNVYLGKEYICESDSKKGDQQQGVTVCSNEEIKKDSDFNTNIIKIPLFVEQTHDVTTYDSPIMTGRNISEVNLNSRMPEQIQTSIKDELITDESLIGTGLSTNIIQNNSMLQQNDLVLEDQQCKEPLLTNDPDINTNNIKVPVFIEQTSDCTTYDSPIMTDTRMSEINLNSIMQEQIQTSINDEPIKKEKSVEKPTIGSKVQILAQDQSIEHMETFGQDYIKECHSPKKGNEAVPTEDPLNFNAYASKEFICKSDLEIDDQPFSSYEEITNESDCNTNNIKIPLFLEHTCDSTANDSPIMADTMVSEVNLNSEMPEQIQTSIEYKPMEKENSVEKILVQDQSIEDMETFGTDYKKGFHSLKKGYREVSKSDLERDDPQQGATASNEEAKKDPDFNTNNIKVPVFIEQTSDSATPIMTDTRMSEINLNSRVQEQIQTSYIKNEPIRKEKPVEKATVGSEEQILVQDQSIEHMEDCKIECNSVKKGYGGVSIQDSSNLNAFASKEFICKSGLERDDQTGGSVFSKEEVTKGSDSNSTDIKVPLFIEQTHDITTYDSPIMTDAKISEVNLNSRMPEQIWTSIKDETIRDESLTSTGHSTNIIQNRSMLEQNELVLEDQHCKEPLLTKKNIKSEVKIASAGAIKSAEEVASFPTEENPAPTMPNDMKTNIEVRSNTEYNLEGFHDVHFETHVVSSNLSSEVTSYNSHEMERNLSMPNETKISLDRCGIQQDEGSLEADKYSGDSYSDVSLDAKDANAVSPSEEKYIPTLPKISIPKEMFPVESSQIPPSKLAFPPPLVSENSESTGKNHTAEATLRNAMNDYERLTDDRVDNSSQDNKLSNNDLICHQDNSSDEMTTSALMVKENISTTEAVNVQNDVVVNEESFTTTALTQPLAKEVELRYDRCETSTSQPIPTIKTDSIVDEVPNIIHHTHDKAPKTFTIIDSSDLLSPGVPGVPWHPQILAGQLTLSQPGGHIMPT